MTPPAAHRVAGHFGELIQGRLGAVGPVVLITLPCPVLTVTAMPKASGTPAQRLSIHRPNGPILGAADAQRFLALLGLQCHADITLTAQMPLGGGAGSSTAGLIALAHAAGWRGSPDNLACACLAIEGATDPLMFDHPDRLLWASRQAKIISQLPALPAFDVLGGFYGAVQPTDAADLNFPDISDLITSWQTAAAAQDLLALAKLAATSAQRTLALRGPNADPTAQLAQDLGALGHVIAHTGSARGLIYAPGRVPPAARAALERAGFTGTLQFSAGGSA